MLRICSLLVLLLATAAHAAPGRFSGTVSVIDGDTIKLGEVTVRLFGIDAPEMAQSCDAASQKAWACGRWVASQVRTRFEGRHASCVQRDIDRYGRSVATCEVAGQDLGQLIVAEGLAFAYLDYSRVYLRDEQRAAAQGRGLHGHQVQSPKAFRAASKPAPQAAPSECAIKGNISSKGVRIYHRPGQRDYAATRISESNGERWFCSERDALAAGWRPAKR
jgi:endonuclease YncB( thermonuclease family)